MLRRVLAAAGAAALGAAVLTAPMETSARGGGGGGHFGGFRPSLVRPIHPVHPPIVRAVRPHFTFRGRFFHAGAGFLRHRGQFSNGGLPYGDWGSAPFYGSYYDPSDVTGTLPPVVYPSLYPPAPPPQPVERVGCRSHTVTVPATSGGEREVTITRC